jgi:hypothetical protein
MMTRLVRWDEPLKLGIAWHDRLQKIAQIKDFDEQIMALSQFDADLKANTEQARWTPTRMGMLFYPRRIPTEKTSQILIGIMLPAVQPSISAGHWLETHRSMFDICLALEEYRLDHRAFPDELGKLAPRYIDRMPVDDFGGQEFVYRNAKEGYLLYSIGKNGRDDGGKTYDDEEDTDDIVIRVPAHREQRRRSL